MDVPFGSRLLSIGEIFDRALTVVIKNFIPLALAYGIIALPFRFFVDWIQLPDHMRFSSAIAAVIANPSLTSRFGTMIADPSGRPDLTFWWYFFAEFLATSLATALLAVMTAGVLRGDRPTLSRALGQSFPRWPRILGVALIELSAVAVLLVTVLVVWIVPAVILFPPSGPHAITPNQALGLVLGALATFVLLAFPLQAWGFCAFGAVALGDAGILRSLRDAWRMVYKRRSIARSFAFGAAFIAGYVFCASPIVLFASLFDALARQYAIGAVIRESITLALVVFVEVAGIIYYLDAKKRYEIFQDAARTRENSAAR